MSTEADKLRADVERIQSELRAAKEALSALLEREASIWIGARVLSREGLEHQVARIETGSARPWVKARPKIKDGSFGSSLRSLYSGWTLVPGQTPPWDDKAIEFAEASQ